MSKINIKAPQLGNINIAVLRTLADKIKVNFSTKRLIRDLYEVRNNTLPTVGVTASPLDDNFYEWHANIRGPADTNYADGIFHFKIVIPLDYPSKPPVVQLFETIKHPNVFGQKICLDMLEEEGWSSAYSILSVLIQLQSFLFEQTFVEIGKVQETLMLIKQQVKKHNEFSCPSKSCKHRGKLSAWPAFNLKEKDVENFMIKKSELELFRQELICFHTKLHNDVCILGIGFNLKRVPRNGSIKEVSPCLDYISIKAYVKERVRKSVNQERFTNWFPLYFGEKKNRALHLAKKAVSVVYTSTSKRFEEKMVLDIFPKLLLTIGIQIMDQQRHASIKNIRLFCHIYCMLLTFIEAYPQLQDQVEEKILQFTNEELLRNKDNTPNLGVVLVFMLISQKIDTDKFFQAYQSEQLDRQVFWIQLKIPELKDFSKLSDSYLDDNRANLCFKFCETSFQTFCFYYMISKNLKKIGKSNQEILKFFEKNLGKLSNQMEEEIQQECFYILTNVDNFTKYYEYLDQKSPDNKTINQNLLQAHQNSKDKKYHGTVQETNKLPDTSIQIQKYIEPLKKLEDFIVDDDINQQMTEDQWKQILQERWEWISDRMSHKPDSTPASLLQFQNQPYVDRLQSDIKSMHQTNWADKYTCDDVQSQILSKMTWRELFMKLDLEYTLLYIDQYPDFKYYYNKLEIVSKYLVAIDVPIVPIKNLKSDYHYLCALLSKLTNLKSIRFHGLVDNHQVIKLKALKSIVKGFNNFQAAGGEFQRIDYQYLSFDKQFGKDENINLFAEKLFHILTHSLNLRSFSLRNCIQLNHKMGYYIGSYLPKSSNFQELDLTQCQITDAEIKLIADGVMRSKQLIRVNLSKNSFANQNDELGSLIYTLAFSPKLEILDINSCIITTEYQKQICEQLAKLLQISGSLFYLNLSNIANLNISLQNSQAFFKWLGVSKTLKMLDLSLSGTSNNIQAIQRIGKAIAFNGINNGNLEVVNLGDVLPNYTFINELYNSMAISKQDFETWYGDGTNQKNFSGNDFSKYYYNNLKVLNFAGKVQLPINSEFNLNKFQKELNPQDPGFMKIIARSKNLYNLQLNNRMLNSKFDADFLTLALDPTRPNFCSNIKILNLASNNLGKLGGIIIAKLFEINKIIEVFDISGNEIGVSGAQSLAESLTNNTSLYQLNIFSNKIDVDGARAFGKCLSINKTLIFIDFGMNKLRDAGISAIANGLSKNNESSIKSLGFKFNFVSEQGIKYFIDTLNQRCKNLKNLYFNKNGLIDFEILQLKSYYLSTNFQQVRLDIFDKLKHIDQDLLDRSIWITVWNRVLDKDSLVIPSLRNFLDNEGAGIIMNIRSRQGNSWPNRKKCKNKFFFVEFANKSSVNRCFKINKTTLKSMNIQIFKAGTGTYLYSKTQAPKKQPLRGATRGRGKVR